MKHKDPKVSGHADRKVSQTAINIKHSLAAWKLMPDSNSSYNHEKVQENFLNGLFSYFKIICTFRFTAVVLP